MCGSAFRRFLKVGKPGGVLYEYELYFSDGSEDKHRVVDLWIVSPTNLRRLSLHLQSQDPSGATENGYVPGSWVCTGDVVLTNGCQYADGQKDRPHVRRENTRERWTPQLQRAAQLVAFWIIITNIDYKGRKRQLFELVHRGWLRIVLHFIITNTNGLRMTF